MSDQLNQFAEKVDQLLNGDRSLPAAGGDPLLRLAARLPEALGAEAPDPAFRARLKAELLEKYGGNVVPFPIPGGVPNRPRQARHAAIAVIAAVAASIALAFGIGDLRHQTAPRSNVAQVPKPTATATVTPAATAVPPPPKPTVRHPRRSTSPTTPARSPGSNVTLPTPPPRPTATTIAVANIPKSTATKAAPTSTPRKHIHSGSAPPTATTIVVANLPPPSATAPPTDTAAPSTATPAPPTPTAVPPTAIPAPPTSTPAPPTVAPASATATVIPATATPVPPTVTAVPATATAVPPTATQPRDTSTPVSSTSTAIPTVVPPTATTPPATKTPRPTRAAKIATQAPATSIPLTATARPSDTARPTSTAAPATATVPAATPTAVPPTVTVRPSATVPASTATSASTATVRPSATNSVPATDTPVAPLPSDTPGAAPTLGPTEVANAAPSANATFSRPAVQAQGSATVTPVAPGHPLFPAPILIGALSPLSDTVPLTPGVILGTTTQNQPNPGSLAVFVPSTDQQSPTDLLNAFGLTPIKALSKTTAGKSLVLVKTGSVTYRAALTVRSAGYSLHLTLLNPVQAGSAADPISAARSFLTQHGLAAGAQPSGLQAGAGGDHVAVFTQSTPYLVDGGRAQVTVSAGGEIRTVDIQWVDTTRAALVPCISPSDALRLIGLGQSAAHSTGALPTANDTVGAPSILYLPAGAANSLYYEPVYVFSGHTFGGADFQIYVPALDPSYIG